MILKIKELQWDLMMRNQNAINWHRVWYFLFNVFFYACFKNYRSDKKNIDLIFCIFLFRYATIDILRMPSSASSLPWCILIPSGTYTTHDWGCVILSHIITHIVFSHIIILNNFCLFCRGCVFKYLRKLQYNTIQSNQTYLSRPHCLLTIWL